MAVNLAPIQGVIELKDDFTGALGLAEAALKNFSKENQESLKAVAGATGLVTAAIGATTAAVIALGNRGSDINDLRATIEQFAGGSKNATDAMNALRAGTMGTVDNFTLASNAAHVLSAGVKLTAADFNTLGSAASVMADRGLGSVENQLQLVSDALVSGRTKALSMALGVIDAGDAEQKYADKLGVTTDQLSERGKAEAHRIEVMRILNDAVKQAGERERDFGEQLKAAGVFFQNTLDAIASGIAKSPVLAAGMKEVGSAFSSAFGGDNRTLVEGVVHAIERGAIIAVDFGLAAVEIARVFNVAWSAIKVTVLGVETVLLGAVTAIAFGIEKISAAGEALHIVPEGTTDAIRDVREQLQGVTVDLAAQTAEASKGLIGASEFDKTLDALGGTLFRVKDAMENASKATAENAEADTISAANAQKLKATQDELNNSMIDRQKVVTALTKSSQELDAIWQDYFATVAKMSGTSADAMKADIESTFNKQVDALNDMDPLFKEKYEALRATVDEKLKQIGSSWSTLRDKSIESQRQAADEALKDYNRMLYGGLTFSREVLDAQLQKWRDLDAAARGYGNEVVAAQKAAEAAAAAHNAELAKQEASLKAIKEANRAAGGSSQFTRANLTDNLLAPWGITLAQVTPWLSHNYSLEDAISFFKRFGAYTNGFPEGPGPRMTGFKEGGLVDIKVGEAGPEVVRVPLGSIVFPNDDSRTRSGGPQQIVNLTMHVNGTGIDIARAVQKVLSDRLKSTRQFGTS